MNYFLDFDLYWFVRMMVVDKYSEIESIQLLARTTKVLDFLGP